MRKIHFSGSILVTLILAAVIGCSKSSDPISPVFTRQNTSSEGANRHLWGMYHVSINPETLTADVIPLRGVMFTCNVTRFMQPPISPTNLVSFKVLPDSVPSMGYFATEISLKHPFPGLNVFSGFDVRGIFMSYGNVVGKHDSSIVMSGETESRLLNPDGYSRFWNPSEFGSYGKLFGFTQGALAPIMLPNSTLNGYKYFADGLGANDSLSVLDPAKKGIFTTGSTNTRRYELQFKTNAGVPIFDFNYAIDASWSLPDSSYSPVYPPEAFSPSANVAEAWNMVFTDAGSTAYYVDDTKNGGKFAFKLEIFDRQAQFNPLGVPGEISAIWVESDSLASPVNVLPISSISNGTTTGSSVFQFELTNLNLTKSGDSEFLVTIESTEPNTYKPQIDAGDNFIYPDAPLAAYFKFKANVSDTAPADDWPTTPVLIDPVNVSIGTHFAVDYKGSIHALYQNPGAVYWSHSSDKGNTWTNEGVIYTPGVGHEMFRSEFAMTAASHYVYALITEWDGVGGGTFTALYGGRLDVDNLAAGWEFSLIWQHPPGGGGSADQNYSGLQIAVDKNGKIMVYAMLYNYASFISKYAYVNDWNSLFGASELNVSPLTNGYLTYYYPQATIEMVADSQGRFFMVMGGNFNDHSNYNGTGQDFGCAMIRYNPSTSNWTFVQSISHPGGSFYWNSCAAGLAISDDDTLHWVNGYSHDNCGGYGTWGGYYTLSYGTGSSSGDHDFYYDDPINDFHNAYVDCSGGGYSEAFRDNMWISSSIGVDSNGRVVIVYQRSINNSHAFAISNDGSGWSDPPVQIDGGLNAQNPYGRMHPSGWYLVTFSDADEYSYATGKSYFVAWK